MSRPFRPNPSTSTDRVTRKKSSPHPRRTTTKESPQELPGSSPVTVLLDKDQYREDIRARVQRLHEEYREDIRARVQRLHEESASAAAELPSLMKLADIAQCGNNITLQLSTARAIAVVAARLSTGKTEIAALLELLVADSKGD